MNENPEGTPNPLNPTPGTGDGMAAGTGLDFVETEQTSEVMTEPEAPKAPEVPETPEAPEAELGEIKETTAFKVGPASFTEAAGSSVPVETPEPPVEEPVASEAPIDPVMQPVSHSNFDTLGMNDTVDEIPVEEVKEETFTRVETPVQNVPISAAPISETPELVARDSIVEPAKGGNKKKVLIIGTIVLLIIAIICGAAAVALMMTSTPGDRVSKAIEKLINGNMPSIVSVQGTIDSFSNAEDSAVSSSSIDFNGSFDVAYNTNTVSAKINTELATGDKVSIGIDELENKDGEVFFKIRGLDTLLGGETTEENKLTDCVNGVEGTDNCLTVAGPVTSGEIVSAYSGLVSTIDDEWILVTGDFAENMEGIGLFDNSSTCLINALGTLPKYSKDIAQKYDASQFITYSTEKLDISKKKNPLYRLTIDSAKLTTFINSLSNNGFVNELNACAGNTATNTSVTTDMIDAIFVNLPTIYVEIDENYNFTRVYFKATTGEEAGSMTTTADLSLSYPAKLDVIAPDEYIDMSNLVNNLLTGILSGETN